MSRAAVRRVLYWTVSILVSGVLLYGALRGVDWGRVGNIIAHADLRFIAAGLALACFSFFVRAMRWRILLNAEGRLGVATVFWANMAGYLGNCFLPARAGEVVRSVLIGRQSGLSKTYALTTALSERMMDAIALVLASAIALLGVRPKPAWMQDVSGGMTIAAAAGIGLVIILPLTSQEKGIRSHVEVSPPEGGLRKRSFIKCEDIRSVSVERLTRRLGRVSPETMAAVAFRLRILIEL